MLKIGFDKCTLLGFASILRASSKSRRPIPITRGAKIGFDKCTLLGFASILRASSKSRRPITRGAKNRL